MAQEERSTHWVAGRDSGVVKLSTDKWDQVTSKVRIYRNALKSRLKISLVTRNSHQPLVGLAMTLTVMRPKKPFRKSYVVCSFARQKSNLAGDISRLEPSGKGGTR